MSRAFWDSFINRVTRTGLSGSPTKLPSQCLGVTGDTDKWRHIVTKARNQYAHRIKNEFLEPEGVDQYLTTAFSLRWLLTGLLLLQADIPTQVLAERFRNYQQYSYFLSSATEWQPDIYA